MSLLLLQAAEEGDVSQVEAFLRINQKSVNIQDSSWETPLMKACATSNIDVVKCLLQNSANVNLQNKYGYTALRIGCLDLELVQLLVEVGHANVNIQDKYGETPLMIASFYDREEVVKYLLEHGANVNLKTKGIHAYSRCRYTNATALSGASAFGYINVVKILLSYSPEINTQNQFGETPFFQAAKYGHTEVLTCLLNHGNVQVDVQNDKGETALMVADSLQTVQFLLKHGNVNINTQDRLGYTALRRACRDNRADLVRCLLENGADPTLCDEYGTTAIMEVLTRGYVEIFQLLIQNPTLSVKHINHRDCCGNTLLHLASDAGNVDFMRMLLKKGAKLNVRNDFSKLPIDMCEMDDAAYLLSKVQLFITLSSVLSIKRLGKKSHLRLFPIDLLKLVSQIL